MCVFTRHGSGAGEPAGRYGIARSLARNRKNPRVRRASGTAGARTTPQTVDDASAECRPVGFSAVNNTYDEDNEFVVANLVQNTIVADANPSQTFQAAF